MSAPYIAVRGRDIIGHGAILNIAEAQFWKQDSFRSKHYRRFTRSRTPQKHLIQNCTSSIRGTHGSDDLICLLLRSRLNTLNISTSLIIQSGFEGFQRCCQSKVRQYIDQTQHTVQHCTPTKTFVSLHIVALKIRTEQMLHPAEYRTQTQKKHLWRPNEKKDLTTSEALSSLTARGGESSLAQTSITLVSGLLHGLNQGGS